MRDMINKLGWQSLELRRRNLRLSLLYKIINDHVAVTASSLNLEKADSRTRATHQHKLKTPRTNTRQLQNFLPCRTIPVWNKLPASVVEASTTVTFSARLARLDPPSKP